MNTKKSVNWILSFALSLMILSQFANAAPELGEDYLKEYFNGSILIARDCKVLLRKGYGKANFKKRISNTPTTIFRIGSLTKQFTAIAVLILEEKGKLSTDEFISKYIPYPNGDKITIHNLLTHTSGIAEYFMSKELIESGNHYYSPEDLINLFKNKPLNFTPGERFQYCNSNYILLGYIIEKVSGLKYGDFIKENIFTPLDMKNSGYDSKTKFKDTAVGYYSIKPKLEEAIKLDMSIAYSAGGLYSTIDDLYKWDQALYTEIIVTKKTLSKMFTPGSQSNNYGYGWYGSVSDTLIFDIMYHTGAIQGFSSYIFRDIKKQIVIIMLSNEEGKNLSGYINMIRL